MTANIFDAIYPWLQKSFWLVQVVVAFGILVAVHEFGHYISAKLTGMKVEEFAIGFGKRIAGFKKGETEYSWRIVPLGGYCKIYGMDEETTNDADGEETVEPVSEEIDRAFNRRPLWARFVVIIAGSLMNVLLAIFLIGIMGSAVGFNFSLIDDVEKGSPADKAGMLPGDKIRLFAYNSQRGHIINAVADSNTAKGVLFRVDREDGSHNIRVHPEMTTDENGETVKRIGIRFSTEDNYSRVIDRVMHDSPYHKAGLVAGDKVVSINGVPAETMPSLYRALLNSDISETNLEILRGDKRYTFVLKDHLIYRTGMVAETVKTDDGYELNIKEAIMDTPAFYLGLARGVRITAVDGNPITEDFDWATFEANSNESSFMITVVDNRTESAPVEVPLSRVMLYPGISFKANYVKVPPHQAFYEASLQTKAFSLMIFDFLNSLFTKKAGVGDLAGPIGVVQMGYRMASEGLINLVFFFSLISVNLGIINLMPIPGLDGGRAVFLIIEMLFRRPIMKAQIENVIHFVGMMLLFGFIIYVTFNDVGRIISMFR
jgi:regulator of sigma E protease